MFKKYITRILTTLLFVFNVAACFAQYQSTDENEPINTFPPKREFRGVWVATVANIDWPSKPGLNSEQQKRELISILDQHQRNGMNAIMLQIRPAADAFYAKGREPWSKWLTGKQGTAPSPGYDPLQFAIEEAHKRAMELHAWFNPYRATNDALYSALSNDHITRKKPEWFFNYGGKKLFNPGLPEVREYICKVILDVVDNYDIDGVHFDDYFYPYPIAGLSIPDGATFQSYPKGFSNINDWRRDNVDQLVKMVSDSVHHHKKFMKFGVSPFGIWRNKKQDTLGSETNGLSNYSELYADARKWVKEGWVDYINPQIYFTFYHRAAPFEKLVDWWSNNSFGRHLYIGQAAYRVNERKDMRWRDPKQIPDQMRYIRNNKRVQGSVFFSSKSLSTNPLGVTDSLRNNFYNYQALPPAMLWLDDTAPNAPTEFTAKAEQHFIKLQWQLPTKSSDGDIAYGFVIYRFNEGERVNIEDPRRIIKIFYSRETMLVDATVTANKRYVYVITAIDRMKNESEPAPAVGVQAE